MSDDKSGIISLFLAITFVLICVLIWNRIEKEDASRPYTFVDCYGDTVRLYKQEVIVGIGEKKYNLLVAEKAQDHRIQEMTAIPINEWGKPILVWQDKEVARYIIETSNVELLVEKGHILFWRTQ
jgi:hypothetical protein